jgi:hypothetical protein
MAAPIFKFKNVRVPINDTNETLIYAVEVGQGERGLDVGALPDEISSVILTVQCSNKRKFVPNRTVTGLVNSGDKLSFSDSIDDLATNTPVTFANFLVTAGNFQIGVTYTIVDVGSTDFTLIGAASNSEGVSFVATGAGSGTGSARPNRVGSSAIVPAGSFLNDVVYTIVVPGDTDFTVIGASSNNVGTTFVATGAGSGTGTARTQGQILPNQTYYVKTIDAPNRTITLSSTLSNGTAGTALIFGEDTAVTMSASFDSTIQLTAKIKDLNTNLSVNLVKDYPILPQNAFDPLNGNLVLTSKLGLYVQTNAKDVDVTVSLLEIANATAA